MKNLKTLRKRAGLTQFALAQDTGIHRWRIAHCELGLIHLTRAEILQIRRVLVSRARRNARALKALAGRV